MSEPSNRFAGFNWLEITGQHAASETIRVANFEAGNAICEIIELLDENGVDLDRFIRLADFALTQITIIQKELNQ